MWSLNVTKSVWSGEMLLILIIVCLILLMLIFSGKITFESGQKRAGKRGEKIVTVWLQKILQTNDILLQNVWVTYCQERTELDNIIINQNGVFIIEVKNYKGKIEGDENDAQWRKFHISRGGRMYFKTVRNPVKQVRRQIYIVSSFLKYYGINVWVEGYVIFVENNAPIESDYILKDMNELEQILHDKERKQLNEKQINQIVDLLVNKQMESM